MAERSDSSKVTVATAISLRSSKGECLLGGLGDGDSHFHVMV